MIHTYIFCMHISNQQLFTFTVAISWLFEFKSNTAIKTNQLARIIYRYFTKLFLWLLNLRNDGVRRDEEATTSPWSLVKQDHSWVDNEACGNPYVLNVSFLHWRSHISPSTISFWLGYDGLSSFCCTCTLLPHAIPAPPPPVEAKWVGFPHT